MKMKSKKEIRLRDLSFPFKLLIVYVILNIVWNILVISSYLFLLISKVMNNV